MRGKENDKIIEENSFIEMIYYFNNKKMHFGPENGDKQLKNDR